MQKLHEFLSRAIDQLLVEFAVAKFAPDKCKQTLPIKEVLVLGVQHQHLVQAVLHDVSGLVNLL